MALNQFGRPISLVTTGPGKTITDIRSWNYKPSREQLADGPSGNKQTLAYLTGVLADELTIVTTDRTMYTSFPQGTLVTSATLTVEDTRTSANTLKAAGAVLTVVMTGCQVVSAIELAGDASGKAATYTITLRQTDKADGTEGTVSVTVAAVA
jgi:hypothetical protein